MKGGLLVGAIGLSEERTQRVQHVGIPVAVKRVACEEPKHYGLFLGENHQKPVRVRGNTGKGSGGREYSTIKNTR